MKEFIIVLIIFINKFKFHVYMVYILYLFKNCIYEKYLNNGCYIFKLVYINNELLVVGGLGYARIKEYCKGLCKW